MTTIDPSKVSLLEVDIEDWLWENPRAIDLGGPLYHVERWVARQLKVHSGIIDLVGVTNLDEMYYKYLVVVEVKNADITPAALTQVCRYADDIRQAIVTETILFQYDNWDVLRVVVGPSISDQTFREAEAVKVIANTFSVSLRLNVSSISWKGDYRERRKESYLNFRDVDFVGPFVRSVINGIPQEDETEDDTVSVEVGNEAGSE